MIEFNVYVMDFPTDEDAFYHNVKKAYKKSIRSILAGQTTNESKLNFFTKLNKAIERLEAI